MKTNRIFLFLMLLLYAGHTQAQQQFGIIVQPSAVNSVPPVHSGAFAVWNGKWIFLGGRIDGLHIMQANQAFPAYGRNDSIYIVDPLSNTRQSAYAAQLSPAIYEALCSANMQFYQDGNHLYMIGGYGKQATQNSWITFPSLISVDLDCLMNTVTAGNPVSSCFRQIQDSTMAVAGGMLEKIDSTYYLVFGHRFDGRYIRDNSMHMFTQQYTHEIRKFGIFDDGITLAITNYSAETDTNNFHRRDLNLAPQIYPNGDYGFTAFGGVFQKNADMPFLTPVDISADTVIHQASFNQNLSQYTSAILPVYDSLNNTMHTVFFGGMSLYTLDTITSNLIQDTLVPFVNTISRVSRDAGGNLAEYKLPVEMPALTGSNAFFILKPALPVLREKIVNLNALSGVVHAGYIVGGLESDFPNIADLDPEGMSRPHATVYDVYIDMTINSVHDLEIRNAVNDLIVYPNPANDRLYMDFNLKSAENCSVILYNSLGEKVRVLFPETMLLGRQHLVCYTGGLKSGLYYCEVKAGKSVKVVKVILE